VFVSGSVVGMFTTVEAQERADELDRLHRDLARTVRLVDPGGVTATDAADLLRRLVAIERLAGAGRLIVAAKAAEAGTWRARGHRSPQDWLAAEQGTSTGDARGDLETSKRLGACPKTEEALREGKVSPKQAQDITDASTADPTAEQDLLGLVEKGASKKELRDESRRRKAAADPDPDATARRIHRNRHVRTGTDPDGTWWLAARGPTAAGAGIMASLRRQADRIFAANRRAGVRENPEAYLFDALTQLLTTTATTGTAAAGTAAAGTASCGAGTTAAGPAGTPNPVPGTPAGTSSTSDAAHPSTPAGATVAGNDERDRDGDEPGRATPDAPPTGLSGDPSTADPDPGGGDLRLPGLDPPGPAPAPVLPGPTGANAKIIVRIDHTALVRGHTIPGETCEIDGFGPVPVEQVRAWMTDAFLAAVLTDGTDITRVVHLGRKPTALQTTALQALGVRCARVGCGRTEGLQIDHRIDWSITKHTTLRELDWLCCHDHGLKTLYGWALEPGTGPRRLLHPDHPDHPDHGTLADTG
jgi:hypothetical protein